MKEKEMKAKKYVSSIFFIVYPLIIIAFAYWDNYISQQFKRHSIGMTTFYFSQLIYFIIFFLVIFFFLIKKIYYNNIFLIIGCIEIVLLQIPILISKISFNLFSVIYSNFFLNTFLFNTVFVLYLSLILNKVLNKKQQL